MKTETLRGTDRPARRGPPSKIVMANSTREWIAAILVFAALFGFMWEYHIWRDRPCSFFTAN